MKTLSQLPLGGQAKIAQVEGSDDVSCRLMEMGLTPGVQVKLLSVAPLGDPIELELRGYRLSVRKSEAARVLVE